MLIVSVKIDERSIRQAEYILRAIPKALPRVMRSAIKRSVDMAATDIDTRVRAAVRMTKKQVRKRLAIKQPSYSNWSGSIGASKTRLGLTAFMGTRQIGRGVSYRITSRKLVKGAFIADITGKGVGSYSQTTAQAKASAMSVFGVGAGEITRRGVLLRRGRARLPLMQLKGPSVHRVITGTPGLLNAVNKTAGDKIGKHINDQIGREFDKWRK